MTWPRRSKPRNADRGRAPHREEAAASPATGALEGAFSMSDTDFRLDGEAMKRILNSAASPLPGRRAGPAGEDANAGTTAGQLDTLLWLEKRGILPNSAGIDSAIGHDNLEIINWLLERNILPSSQVGVNMLAQNGHLDTLKFLEQRGICNQNGANKALLRDRMGTLSWLEERNILPNIEGADLAFRGSWRKY